MSEDLRLGSVSNGKVLVCHGDDTPDSFAGWLLPLTEEFDRLLQLAEDYGIDLDPQDGTPPVQDIVDFCERLGISFDHSFWEGSLISGVYYCGWMPRGTIRSAKSTARKLLRTLDVYVDSEARKAIFAELQHGGSLRDFLSRIDSDRERLHRRVSDLESSLASANKSTNRAQKAMEEAAAVDKLNSSCLEMAIALLEGDGTPRRAGPLALWSDGVIYAIREWDGVELPQASPIGRLLDCMRKSNRTVLELRLRTVRISPLSGNAYYGEGPQDLKDWQAAWGPNSHRTALAEFTSEISWDRSRREFNVTPPNEHRIYDDIRKFFQTR